MGIAHSDFFPKITLTGAAGRQGASFSGLTLGAGNFFSVGPAIKLPIFTGGRLRANMEAAKQRLEQARLVYEQTVLRSLEEGRGETTVPWYYGPIAPLQDALPNVFTRVLSRVPKAP